MVMGARMIARMQRENPQMLQLSGLLQQRSMIRRFQSGQAFPPDHEVSVYIASHFASVVTNTTTWSNVFTISLINGEMRRFAEQSVAEHPNPKPVEVAASETALKPWIAQGTVSNPMTQSWFPLLAAYSGLMLYVGVPALIAALLFRGGLIMRAFGLTVVRPDGLQASRPRVFWRALVAWAPVLLAPVIFGCLKFTAGEFWAVMAPTWLVTGLLAVSCSLPGRSLQDRLAGTWLVPR
jgi:hypothetical protein